MAAAELTVSRARDLVRFLGLGTSAYAKLVECCREAGPPVVETVVVEVEVERPQVCVHDIRRVEQVAVLFSAGDESAPEVLALRADFPPVPHLNLRPAGDPPSLCLSELNWDAQRLRWTPAAFVEQLRRWLALTAVGKLHAADQSLEPLVATSAYHLVVPPDLFTTGSGPLPERLLVTRAGPAESARVLLAVRPEPKEKEYGSPYIAISLLCKPQQHGVIRHAPENLKELHHLLLAGDINLLTELRTRLPKWTEQRIRDAKLILIVGFPKTRGPSEVVEATDLRGFLCDATVAEIGKAIGVWGSTGHGLGQLLGGSCGDDDNVGCTVPVDTMIPTFGFSRSAAARMNGLEAPDDQKITLVGAGALGSQVAMNLVRAGYGRWTIVDEDHLLPHNLARHALIGLVGFPKAQLMAASMDALTESKEAAKAIVADVLHPGETAAELDAIYAGSGLILDMSASVPVARHLARDIKSGARRVSMFLNPSGTDLVVLAEDANRLIPLDCLEMQYYRSVASRDDLAGHMDDGGHPVRYAQSCRDVTSTIPQDLVAVLAGIGARALRQAAENPDATIRIWRIDPQTMAVREIRISPARAYAMKFGDWTLCTDEEVLRKIASLREARLPNETGGVLIGSYDLSRKVVYVVDTIASPPDSKEWPTLYIRGAEELPTKVEDIKIMTGQNLEYAGEWHSHPRRCSCDPSSDDRVVFAWLIRSMDVDGLPALMLIAGDGASFKIFLGEMA